MRNLGQHISDLQSGYKDRRKQRVFGTGYDPKRESIEEDSTPTRAGRRDSSYCGRGLPEVEVKLRPQIRGTDLKVLGLNIGAQVARGSTEPAGRVFSLQATRLVSSTGRPVVGSAAKHRGAQDAPTTWPGSCGSGAPRPGWSRDTRYLSQSTAPDRTAHYMQQACARFGSRMGQGPEVPHLSTTGR
jgi:hypothetical protein